MSKIYAKIHPLMDELQYCMEHNIHLKDEDKAIYIGMQKVKNTLSPISIHDVILSQIFRANTKT